MVTLGMIVYGLLIIYALIKWTEEIYLEILLRHKFAEHFAVACYVVVWLLVTVIFMILPYGAVWRAVFVTGI